MATIGIPDDIYDEGATFIKNLIKLRQEGRKVKLIEKCKDFLYDILEEVVKKFLEEIGD